METTAKTFLKTALTAEARGVRGQPGSKLSPCRCRWLGRAAPQAGRGLGALRAGLAARHGAILRTHRGEPRRRNVAAHPFDGKTSDAEERSRLPRSTMGTMPHEQALWARGRGLLRPQHVPEGPPPPTERDRGMSERQSLGRRNRGGDSA